MNFLTFHVGVVSRVSKIRQSVQLPGEIDVNGAAWALVRLQDTYNLTIDDLIQGQIKGSRAIATLTGKYDLSQIHLCNR